MAGRTNRTDQTLFLTSLFKIASSQVVHHEPTLRTFSNNQRGGFSTLRTRIPCCVALAKPPLFGISFKVPILRKDYKNHV